MARQMGHNEIETSAITVSKSYQVPMAETHSVRHCERSEATQGDTSGAGRAALGCFVAALLAMTE